MLHYSHKYACWTRLCSLIKNRHTLSTHKPHNDATITTTHKNTASQHHHASQKRRHVQCHAPPQALHLHLQFSISVFTKWQCQRLRFHLIASHHHHHAARSEEEVRAVPCTTASSTPSSSVFGEHLHQVVVSTIGVSSHRKPPPPPCEIRRGGVHRAMHHRMLCTSIFNFWRAPSGSVNDWVSLHRKPPPPHEIRRGGARSAMHHCKLCTSIFSFRRASLESGGVNNWGFIAP